MNQQSLYDQLVIQIIQYQEKIIGPLAWSQAKEVPGLELQNQNVTLKGNGKTVLTSLIDQYKTLFGQASVEACKDAIKESQITVSPQDLPDILK